MGKKYDVVAITGTYQKDGQDKAIYKNVGAVIEKDGKFYLSMDSLVTVHRDGHVVNFFSLFAPKVKQAQAAPQQPNPDFDDDIPW